MRPRSLGNSFAWCQIYEPRQPRHLDICSLPTQNGWAPLHTAAGGGHVEVLKALLENEFTDVDIKNSVGG